MKGRILRICLCFCLLHTVVFAQQLRLDWCVPSEEGSSYVTGTCVDSKGNSYTAGYFKEINIQGTSITSQTEIGFAPYVCKLDSEGELVWLKRFGVGYSGRAKSIHVDGNDDVIFTGEFEDSIQFCDTTFVAVESQDEFIVKIDGEGTCLWVQHVDGYGPMPILTDDGDNIYTCTSGATAIDGIEQEGNTILTKLTPEGEVLWMKPLDIKLHYDSRTKTVAMNDNGIVIGGTFQDTTEFAGVQHVPMKYMDVNPFSGDTAYYFAKNNLIGLIDTAGTEIKAIALTSTHELLLNAVNTNPVGDIFVVGSYSGLGSVEDSVYIRDTVLTGGSRFGLRFSKDFTLKRMKNVNDRTVRAAWVTDTFIYHALTPHFFLKKFDLDYNLLDSIAYGLENVQPEVGIAMATDTDQNLIVAGIHIQGFLLDNFQLEGNPSDGYKIFISKFRDLGLSVDESEQVGVSLYPNPVSDFVSWDVEKVKFVELFDINGRRLIADTTDQKLDMRTYGAGVYLLKVYTDSQVFHAKLVKR